MDTKEKIGKASAAGFRSRKKHPRGQTVMEPFPESRPEFDAIFHWRNTIRTRSPGSGAFSCTQQAEKRSYENDFFAIKRKGAFSSRDGGRDRYT